MDRLKLTTARDSSSSSEIIRIPNIKTAPEGQGGKENRATNGTVEIEALQDIPKLRAFLLEKLPVRQLINLIVACDEVPEQVNDLPPLQITTNTRTNNIRAHPMTANNSKRKVPFASLIIGNFAIQSPHLAHNDVNYVEVCKNILCLIYKMNFMLDNNWCSCTVSTILSYIKSIVLEKTTATISLSQPSTVEASYANGVLCNLGRANTEVENSCTHKIKLRTAMDWNRLKTFLVSADPSINNKINIKAAQQVYSFLI